MNDRPNQGSPRLSVHRPRLRLVEPVFKQSPQGSDPTPAADRAGSSRVVLTAAVFRELDTLAAMVEPRRSRRRGRLGRFAQRQAGPMARLAR